MDDKNKILEKVVKQLSSSNIFIYSPAHIEEIAVLNKGVMDDEAIRQLSFIEKLSNSHEFLPSEKNTVLVKEKPLVCYKRVIEKYDRNPHVEKNENEFLTTLKNLDPNGSLSREVSNNNENILSQDNYHKDLTKLLCQDVLLIMLYGKNISESDVILFRKELDKQTHFVKERAIELALNYLEFIRYKPEKVKKSRSRMHDCSHAIYASSADIFVTNDNRFLNKVKAVYHYFSINTEILSLNKFIEQNTL